MLLVFVAIPLAVLKFGDDKQEDHKQAAYLSDGLSVAIPLKNYVVEYDYGMGKFPADNSEARLPQPDTFADQAVRSVAVRNGVIVVTYSDVSGVDGGIIRIIPQIEKAGRLMKWSCETPSYPHISEYMPQCYFVEK